MIICLSSLACSWLPFALHDCGGGGERASQVELSLNFIETDTDEEGDDAVDPSSSSDEESEEEKSSSSDEVQIADDLAATAPIRLETQVLLNEFSAQNSIHSKTRFSADLLRLLTKKRGKRTKAEWPRTSKFASSPRSLHYLSERVHDLT